MRNDIPSKYMALKVVGPLGDYLAARIQRLDMPSTIPSTTIEELGNTQHAGTITDTPEVNATFQAMDVSIKLFAALTGTDADSYPAAGVDISNLNEVDLIGVVRSDTTSDYVKSIHLRKCQITGFTFTYSVDGEATEEYTAGGSEKRWFRYDVVVDTFEAAATSPVSLSETALQLKNDDYVLSVILDGAYLSKGSGSPAAGEYVATASDVSFADTVASKLVVVYHANPTGNNWSDVSDSTIPAAIRGRSQPVYIGLNNVLRVQSVTIRGTFPSTPIREMGNTNLVGVTIQNPQVTGDLAVLDTDLSLVSLLAQGSLTDTDNEYLVSEFTYSGLSLLVRIYDPSTTSETRTDSDVLKTVFVPEIKVTSEGHTTNVGGSASQTFGWESVDGRCLVFSGYPSGEYLV